RFILAVSASMKIPRFKPVYLNNRLRPWAVSIPPYLSPTGKPQRRHFLTLEECKAFADYMRRQWDDHEHDSTYLTRDQLTEAARAYKLIEQNHCNCNGFHSLLSIMQDFIERERLASKSVTLEVLINEYAAARSSASPHYLRDLQSLKDRLPTLICTTTVAQI